jgi:hypothetical protein
MWHIVLQTSEGRVYRVAQEDKPVYTDIVYWEDYFSDRSKNEEAVVFNYYYTED